jgi:hypothetical protein
MTEAEAEDYVREMLPGWRRPLDEAAKTLAARVGINHDLHEDDHPLAFATPAGFLVVGKSPDGADHAVVRETIEECVAHLLSLPVAAPPKKSREQILQDIRNRRKGDSDAQPQQASTTDVLRDGGSDDSDVPVQRPDPADHGGAGDLGDLPVDHEESAERVAVESEQTEPAELIATLEDKDTHLEFGAEMLADAEDVMAEGRQYPGMMLDTVRQDLAREIEIAGKIRLNACDDFLRDAKAVVRDNGNMRLAGLAVSEADTETERRYYETDRRRDAIAGKIAELKQVVFSLPADRLVSYKLTDDLWP